MWGRRGRGKRHFSHKAPVDDDSIQQLKHLRPQARRSGSRIRKQRPARRSGETLYRLLDRQNGEVIRRDVALVDVPTELFWILRDQRRALRSPVSLPEDHCPSCGEQRMGFFRYCRACGFDYEPEHIPMPGLDTRTDVLWLQEPAATHPPFTLEPAPLPAHHAALPAPPISVDVDAPPRRGFRSRFASPPELAVGVVVGVLLGVMATIVGARS